jgi:diguanylate cyclase
MDERNHHNDKNEISNHFRIVADKILSYLHDRLGFQLWAVTRTYSDHWIMLATKDNGYNIKNGDVFFWPDSFCSRMVQSKGPQIAPKVEDVPEYITAPIGKEYSISSYIGIPLRNDDGTLFGTLCAIDPVEKPDSIKDEYSLIFLFADILSQLIQAEIQSENLLCDIERARLKLEIEPITKLYNKRGWNILLAREQKCCDMFGSPALIVMIKLDENSNDNDLLVKTADIIKYVFRNSDISAYIEKNIFIVLVVEIDYSYMKEFVSRIKQTLKSKNIPAQIGWAEHNPRNKLKDTQIVAENNLSPIN